LDYYRNNLLSLVNLLDVMKRYGIPDLVFSSSCTVYGQPEKLPVTENAPLQPAMSPAKPPHRLMSAAREVRGLRRPWGASG